MSDALIDATVRRVVDECRPDEVALCGSYRTGTYRPDSDLDVLVIVDDACSSQAIHAHLMRVFARWPVSVDAIVRTHTELRRALQNPRGSFEGRLIAVSRCCYRKPGAARVVVTEQS